MDDSDNRKPFGGRNRLATYRVRNFPTMIILDESDCIPLMCQLPFSYVSSISIHIEQRNSFVSLSLFGGGG